MRKLKGRKTARDTGLFCIQVDDFVAHAINSIDKLLHGQRDRRAAWNSGACKFSKLA